jgi:hypothetical protein
MVIISEMRKLAIVATPHAKNPDFAFPVRPMPIPAPIMVMATSIGQQARLQQWDNKSGDPMTAEIDAMAYRETRMTGVLAENRMRAANGNAMHQVT